MELVKRVCVSVEKKVPDEIRVRVPPPWSRPIILLRQDVLPIYSILVYSIISKFRGGEKQDTGKYKNKIMLGKMTRRIVTVIGINVISTGNNDFLFSKQWFLTLLEVLNPSQSPEPSHIKKRIKFKTVKY